MPRLAQPPREAVIRDEQAYLFAAASTDLSHAWWSRAACTSAPPEVFFPISEMDLASKSEALSYCVRCPVRLPCLEVAVGDRTLLGIWGGTDERERHRLRQQAESS